MSQNRSQRAKLTGHISSVAVGPYVLTLEREHFYQAWRYHWTICAARRPDELVSWGHAPTREMAEAVAGNEVEKLEFGAPHGKRVNSPSKASTAKLVQLDKPIKAKNHAHWQPSG